MRHLNDLLTERESNRNIEVNTQICYERDFSDVLQFPIQIVKELYIVELGERWTVQANSGAGSLLNPGPAEGWRRMNDSRQRVPANEGTKIKAKNV